MLIQVNSFLRELLTRNSLSLVLLAMIHENKNSYVLVEEGRVELNCGLYTFLLKSSNSFSVHLYLKYLKLT